MTYITFSLLGFSVAGLVILFVFKSLGRHSKHSYLLARIFFVIFGLAIFLLGVCFHLRSWPYASFFSTLFYVLGAQISLWSIGISGEILGNLPHTDEASEFSRSPNAISQTSFALYLAMVALVAFFSGNLLDRFPWSRDVGFIKQVSAETRLPEKPDWVTEMVKSTDRFGKEVVVEIGVLWDPYRWAKASTEYVSIDDGEKVKFSIEDVIRNFQNGEKRPIIVVGTASHENAVENPEQEIGRAQARADMLVAVCGAHFINRPHIYSLNLGAFRTDRRFSVFSASERRVILLVIKKGEDSLDLTSGVKNALVRAKVEQGFIFDARDYSLFETTRSKVMPRLNF